MSRVGYGAVSMEAGKKMTGYELHTHCTLVDSLFTQQIVTEQLL